MPDSRGLWLRIAIAAVLVLAAGALGLYLGKLSVPNDLPEYEAIVANAGRGLPPRANEKPAPKADEPPVYFHVGINNSQTQPVILKEISMAALAGVNRYALPVGIPWKGTETEARASLELLSKAVEANPAASFLLMLSLDPPADWLDANPAAARKSAAGREAYVSPTSSLWITEAKQALDGLFALLQETKLRARIQGVVFGAFEQGRWQLPKTLDSSDVNTEGFRAWLTRRYQNDTTLQTAWKRDDLSLASAPLPTSPENNAGNAFFSLGDQQAWLDFLEYTSDSLADAIASFMTHTKATAGQDFLVFARYGQTFEIDSAQRGHYAMGRLLDSDLDGFAGNVSHFDRGLGGAGGPASAISSVRTHQKKFLLIDDTRTGIGRVPETGEIARMQGVRAEDVYNVQRRNFGFAAVHGLGILWSDPESEGWLHDEKQWAELGRMRDLYAELHPPIAPALNEESAGAQAASSEAQKDEKKSRAAKKSKKEEAPKPATEEPKANDVAASDSEAATTANAEASPPPTAEETPPLPVQAELEPEPLPSGPPDNFRAGLTVVIDEKSRLLESSESPLGERLLLAGRDAAMRAGISLRFCLLQDLLDEVADPSPIYLFLNSFRLTGDERARLHARLEREQAFAIWCYTPGLFSPLEDPDGVSKTIMMKTRKFDGLATAGSTYTLGGRWFKEGSTIGSPLKIAPLFHVDDNEADTLARYTESQKVSIAVRVTPEGWTSIFVAEPALNPGLLRELLRIVEQRICFRYTDREYQDTAHIGLNLMALHAKQAGEISISLGGLYEVRDLFDPNAGWPEKESFVLPMTTGETRLLRVSPL